MSTPADALLLGLQLGGRRVVAVGGGPVGERRIADYLDAGADVVLIAPTATAGLRSRAERGELTWLRRRYADGDLFGAWLVHTATGDAEVDRTVARTADRLRIWCVNAGDASCTSARTPARGSLADPETHRVISFAVLSGEPRMSVRLRDRILAWLPAATSRLRPPDRNPPVTQRRDIA